MARLVVGVNDLATTHPDLAAELVDQSLATQLSAGSNKKVEWCCKVNGHVWSAVVWYRTGGGGCPYCSNKAVLIGFNDLATTHPELAAQLVDQTLATQLSAGSHKKVEWCCKAHGHVWTAAVHKRSDGCGCPYCAGKAVLPGFNDIPTTNPELAAELVDQSLGETLIAFTHRKVEWQCSTYDHTYIAAVSHRSRGRGCPYCSNKAVLIGFNDLATTHPELAAELVDQSLGREVTFGAERKLQWQCQREPHTWTASPNGRTGGSGCPICAGQLVLVGFNDLATTNPELAAELVDQSLGETLIAFTHRKVEWQCSTYDHTYLAAVSNRSNGNGCSYCAGKAVLPGFNDLATTHPELAAELVDQSLGREVTFGTNKTLDWSCRPHGHVWASAVADRSFGNGCPYCSNKALLVGFNDLATTHPELAAQLVDPSIGLEVTYGSPRKPLWRCKEGHTWRAVVASRSSGVGCSECAKTGFSQVGIGWLYLVATPGRRVFKFGIANDLEGRLDKHYRQGFTEHVEDLFFEYGGEALAIETALRRHKKAMGWQNGMTKAEMPDGYTETFLADDCGEDFTLSKFRKTL